MQIYKFYFSVKEDFRFIKGRAGSGNSRYLNSNFNALFYFILFY